MNSSYDITDYQGESRLEFILSMCNSQQQDGTVVFFDANLLNIDLTDHISLLKESSKHFRFSHQYSIKIIYRWHFGTPEGVIPQTEEIGEITAM